MGMTTCRECGKDVSDAADTCPHCGVTSPSQTDHWIGVLKSVGGWIVIGIIAVVAISYVMNAGFSTCNVVSIRNHEDAFIVNGELDYGVVTKAVVELDGGGREVTVEVRLETNEGDFVRAQRINVSENGRREVQVQFPEPTLGARISRSVATCR